MGLKNTSKKSNEELHKSGTKLDLELPVRALCSNLRVRDCHDDEGHGSNQRGCTWAGARIRLRRQVIELRGSGPWLPRAEVVVESMNGVERLKRLAQREGVRVRQQRIVDGL